MIVSIVAIMAILIVGTFVLMQKILDDEVLQDDVSNISSNASSNQCNGIALCITEKVTHIIDGDTILLENGQKVRISLTNTPEIYQSGYNEAMQFTANLCPVGTTVFVDQDDMQPYDKFNRLLGKVICGNKILNAELLYNAHANILTQYCPTSEFANESWATRYGC